MPLQATGNVFEWEAERYPEPGPARRVLSTWRVLVLCAGLAGTLGAAACVWFGFSPSTLVQTRIVADSSGTMGRAALAAAALRIGTAPGQSAILEEEGDALVLATEDAQPSVAKRRARSLVDSLLNLGLAPEPVVPVRPRPAPGPSSRAALLAERDRLFATANGIDARAAVVSASLTNVSRDIAAGVRSVTDRRAGRETLDKGAAVLAELQLQRIQLAARYQDDYPAVAALDGEIRTLRTFLQDEGHRLDAAVRAATSDPADPILGSERDRLRAELNELNDRRVATSTALAATARSLATTPLDQASPPPETVVSRPGPVLIEGSTTISSAPDSRWLSVPAVMIGGLILSLLAWFKPRRRSSLQAELLLQRVEALLQGPLVALPSEGYSTLTREMGRWPIGAPPRTPPEDGHPLDTWFKR